MGFTTSPNMQLPVPGVGTEQGPQYAFDVNNCFTLVDQHDHTPGKGVQITPAGININTSLNFNSNFATNLAGLSLVSQLSTPITLSTIYESGDDLFFLDGVGNPVRITQNGAVAGTPGSIANLLPPASVSYVSGSKTFVFQSNTNIAANIDAASYLLRNISPNSTFALTLQPPSALGSNYALTLPTIPVSYSFLTIDPSGIIAPMSTYPDVGSNGQQLTANSGNASGVFWTASQENLNMGVSASVAANALTINLLTATGATPSVTSPVIISFRDSTATTGQTAPLLVTSALSIVVPSGATLGHKASATQYIYLYAQNNSGAVQLAVSGINAPDDLTMQTSTTISAASDSGNVLYATLGIAAAPIRLLARLKVSEAVPGTWSVAPSEVSINPEGCGIQPAELSSLVSGTDLNITSFSTTSTSLVSAGSFSTASNPPVGRPVLIRAVPLANGSPDSDLILVLTSSVSVHAAVYQIIRDSDSTVVNEVLFGMSGNGASNITMVQPISALNCVDISDGSSSYTLKMRNILTTSDTVNATQLKLTASVM